ncbi:VWA domain-containing protein [Falsihalocynthiibacter sp. S25ZX9]|uniref:vWA domain-containing protein n=1 Tax=Falsihalocynthiibacter sp. S25ZX9 TaxID=3240870 RepID=UPI00350FF9C9
MTLPRALDPFVGFAQALRGARFAISPDQTVDFITSIGILGPRDMTDIYRSGRALFSIPPERVNEYDAIFRAVFLDQVIQAPADGDEEDDLEAYEPTSESTEIEAADDESEVGAEATTVERLGQRYLGRGSEEAVQRLIREASGALPRRTSYRRQQSKSGDRIDMRRTLRDVAKREGEVFKLFQSKRKTRQRRVLLLIDVSGSMKERSEELLRLAHAVVQTADHAEVFTLGTRLTRITTALRPTDRGQALARVAQSISDFDGGTRIGDALAAFLSVPRYAGFARGAAVVVLSDGLETGTPDVMIDAVRRLSRSAWRLDWLTPLAHDPDYTPATQGLVAILPVLDHLGDGNSAAAVTDHILTMARRI